MARKKKLLPKDFEDKLKQGDLDALKAVFDTCELDARGGVFKQTALAFAECPDDLARWLVAQGADIHAGDSYGETPLHSRARHWKGQVGILIELGADVNHDADGRATPLQRAADSGHVENVRALLAHGASPDATDRDGHTPLEYALQRCSNTGIEGMAEVAQLLLDAGARPPAKAKELVTQIGERFEFHRSNFNPDYLATTSAALERLYALFDVAPVAPRKMHDGTSPIIATADSWQERHQELWELLVPPKGASATVQGEVIRIAGRITNELDGNGGGNWDGDFRRMADAFLTHVGSGTPLPPAELARAAEAVAEAKRKGDDSWRLCELAVQWVALNPNPMTLPPPAYER